MHCCFISFSFRLTKICVLNGFLFVFLFMNRRYSSKTSCAPAQLTIFYGGMVNVYDDISPEKVCYISCYGNFVYNFQINPFDVLYEVKMVNLETCLKLF